MTHHLSLNTNTPIRYQVFTEPLDRLLTKFVDKPRLDEHILAEDRVTYADHVPNFDFHQVLLGFSGTVDHVYPTNLEMSATSSYNVLAVRKGEADNFTPVVVEGLIETSDGKFIYGIRAGNVKDGDACIAPAGHCDSNDRGENAVFSAFYKELKEELGLLPNDISNPLVLGCMTDPDFTCGMNFVFYAETDLSFEEINRAHQLALGVYLEAKERGADEKTAREAISDAGYLNIDAWEHSQKIAVVNDQGVIDHIVKTKNIEHEGNNFPLLDIGRMSLVIYNESEGLSR